MTTGLDIINGSTKDIFCCKTRSFHFIISLIASIISIGIKQLYPCCSFLVNVYLHFSKSNIANISIYHPNWPWSLLFSRKLSKLSVVKP